MLCGHVVLEFCLETSCNYLHMSMFVCLLKSLAKSIRHFCPERALLLLFLDCFSSPSVKLSNCNTQKCNKENRNNLNSW
jgi:hypothetical protein